MENSDKQIAYFLARLTMGIAFMGHGLAHIPRIPDLRIAWIKSMSNSIFPPFIIYYSITLLPFLELIAGLLLTFGFFTRITLMVAFSLTLVLLFVSSLLEDWGMASIQVLYGIFFYFLIRFRSDDQITLDNLLKKQ